MSDEKLFGNILTALRQERLKAASGDGDEDEKKRWTQLGVANALEVHRATYSGWENGHHLPKPNDLRAIAKLFRLSDEERDLLYRAATQAPPIQESSIIDNLPFKQNPFFTGRESELKQLREQLQETGTAAITQPITISGLGGVGKTELALEYAHRSDPNVYRTVLWVNAADERALQASYDELAETLKLPERDEQKLDRRIQAVKHWLKTHTNWLLIMDNADNLPLAESFLPAKPLGHVVFTTRSQNIDNIAANQIYIDTMELDDGLAFLLRRSRKLQVDTDNRKAALKLVKLLGGHPLALDQAGAYIHDTGLSFTDYLARYRIERSCLLNKRRPLKSKDSKHSRHPLPVAATLKLSIEDAGVQHPLATDILDFCAFLQPDAIPEELFQHDDSFKYGTTEFDDAIATLHSYSLIKRNTQEKTLSLHRLVQAVLIDDMLSDLQKQWRKRVMSALIAAFPKDDFKGWRRFERLISHVLTCVAWTEDELTTTIETADLFSTASSYLKEQGQYLAAKELMSRAVTIYKQHFGADHTYTMDLLHDLALLYFLLGEYSDAESLFMQVLAYVKLHRAFGYFKTVGTQHHLAILYLFQGKERQAESLIEEAREGILEKYYKFDPEMVTNQLLSAILHYSQGKDEQAALQYQEAFTIWEENLSFNREVGLPGYQLVSLLHEQGKYKQADALYERYLSIEEQQFGTAHPYIQEIMKSYADLLHRFGRDAEARSLEVNGEPSN